MHIKSLKEQCAIKPLNDTDNPIVRGQGESRQIFSECLLMSSVFNDYLMALANNVNYLRILLRLL